MSDKILNQMGVYAGGTKSTDPYAGLFAPPPTAGALSVEPARERDYTIPGGISPELSVKKNSESTTRDVGPGRSGINTTRIP